MNISYPKYYEEFVCIAGKCPDSCCKEWCVDVDETSAAFYRNLSGPLGDRLRQVLRDTESGTVMTIENGQCPMWQQDGLCRIQAELGHDALCKTCREYPRLRHDYDDFTELGLELSCPEAARLILTCNYQEWVTKTTFDNKTPEYDREAMDMLRRSRKGFLDFLDTTALPFPQILAILLLYAYDVQEELDGGSPAVLSPEYYLKEAYQFANNAELRAFFTFFQNLEILTSKWKMKLQSPLKTPIWGTGNKALLRYFINRYWLQTIADYDIVCRAKFAVAACILIGYLGGDFIETAQLFSKEIENDPDNMEAIFNGAYQDFALTDLNLFGILLKQN